MIEAGSKAGEWAREGMKNEYLITVCLITGRESTLGAFEVDFIEDAQFLFVCFWFVCLFCFVSWSMKYQHRPLSNTETHHVPDIGNIPFLPTL